MPAPEPARRRGPKTPEGKARAALNATKHGLRARRFTLLPHEDPAEFEALAAATRAAYRPACPIERELVEALAVALWREIRADRLEGEVLADIPPADGSRGCGSDLLQDRHRASFALLLRYRAQAAGGVRRAQDALARHRALVEEARGRAEAEPRADRTNELAAAERTAGGAPAADPIPEAGADPIPEAAAGPPRAALREAVRKALNPLDTPFLAALGRDPDLVLPVPGLRPEAWPLAQHLADPEGRPIEGQGPYRRVPHLGYGDWLANQHVLPLMEAVRARAAAPAAEPDRAEPPPGVAHAA
jgi:hypothetical protein